MIAALFEILLNQSFLLDAAGLAGIGLVAVGAIQLAHRYHSINAPLMTWGAVTLILGRLGILAYQSLATSSLFLEAPRWVVSMALNVPVGLLTLGVGLVVAGFWLHEREVEARFAPPVA